MEIILQVLTAVSTDISDPGETLVSDESPWTTALSPLPPPISHDHSDDLSRKTREEMGAEAVLGILQLEEGGINEGKRKEKAGRNAN